MAPVGLLGVHKMIARVLGVSALRAASTSGHAPALLKTEIVLVSMPSIVSHIEWLKYHGAGRITLSPGEVSAIIAEAKAWLHPEVMPTSLEATDEA